MNKRQMVVRVWPIIVIFLANFLLKLFHIGHRPLWYDEIISVKDTFLDFGHIKHESEWDANPPFYYYVLWVWAKVFGVGEVAVRSLSALLTSAAASLFFVLMKRAFTIRAAWLSVLLFTLHPFLFYYSQEARSYGLLIFLVVLHLNLFYCSIVSNAKRWQVFLGICSFLLFYTHYLTLPLVVVQVIWSLASFGRRRFVIISQVLLPVLLVFLRFTKKQFEYLLGFHQSAESKFSAPGISELANTLSELAGFWPISLVSLVGLILFFLKKRAKSLNSSEKFALYITSSFWLCILLLFLVGQVTYVFYPRYVLYLTPFLLASYSLVFSKDMLLFPFVGLQLILFLFKLDFSPPPQMDYRTASYLAKIVQNERQASVLLETRDVLPLFTYYYDVSLLAFKGPALDSALASRKIYAVGDGKFCEELSSGSEILLLQTFVPEWRIGLKNVCFHKEKYRAIRVESIQGVCVHYYAPK